MFYLADAALFALFTLALLSLGLGTRAPQRSLLELLVLPALAILGASGLAIWIVGSLGFYNGIFWAPLFWIGWALWMFARRRQIALHASRLWPAARALSALEKLLAFYLLATWALVFVLSLAPPGGADYDGLVYHLAVPAHYARMGRIAPLPYDHHSYFPLTLEMLFGVGLAVRGAVFAKLFHWLMLPLCCGVLIALGARAGERGRLIGLLAAALFTSLPMTLTESSTAYIDLGFTAFAAAAVLCFVIVSSEFAAASGANSAREWAWSGAFCGFCLGTKYFGWLILGFLGVWLCVQTVRDKTGARPLIYFGASALILGLGWYARNWIWTGNPVFPFAYGAFGGQGWTAQMARRYDDSQAIYGFGHSLTDLIMLPWRLATTPLNVGQPWWPLLPGAAPAPLTGLFETPGLFLQIFPGPALFAFGIPALLARAKPRPILLAASLFGFLWVFWALSSQQVRYLFPALALLSVVAGWGIAQFAPRLPLARWIGGALLVAWLMFAPVLTVWCARGSWQVIGGAQTPAAYLARNFAGYDAMQRINTDLPPAARVAIYGEPRDFYLQRDYFWADDGHNTLLDYSQIRSGAQLADALEKQGATYVLWNAGTLDPRTGTVNLNGGAFGPPQPLFDEMVNARRAQFLFEKHGYRVYELK